MPALLVVPVASVVHEGVVLARRWTCTERARYPAPVFTDTGTVTLYPTAPVSGLVTHPATTAPAPEMPVTLRVAVAAAEPVELAGTYTRKYQVPVVGTV
ncbi:hypothetical protein [Terrabacter sp. 2RAF25]|uniref:hypothetical protein n=1 Tax=Terrabacter sp. 2RAF25 TaxID=3232998 RepID=UPI003F959993